MAFEAPDPGPRRFLERGYAPYVGMLAGTLAALALLYLSVYLGVCGGFLVGIVLYMVARSFGADWRKLAVTGVVFMVVGTLFCAFAITRPMFEGDGSPMTSDGFTAYVTPHTGDDVAYRFTVSYDLPSGATVDGMEIAYGGIDSAYLRFIVVTDVQKAPMAPSGGGFTYDTVLEGGKAYAFRFIITYTDGEQVTKESAYFIGPVTEDGGAVTAMCLSGSAYFIGVYVMVVFALIVLFTTWMRSGLERTRARLEAEGRLYPQGYGRCGKCGTIVLPGEVVCRKCGEYIDVPEHLRPKKVDYFECSACGKEVPEDADVCPSCGERFEGEEVEVFGAFECSACGKEVPEDAVRCPHCGLEFEEDR